MSQGCNTHAFIDLQEPQSCRFFISHTKKYGIDSDQKRSIRKLKITYNIEILQDHEPIVKSSSLQNVDPCLDKEGVLQVGGTCTFGIITGDLLARSNRPIIIPKNSPCGLSTSRVSHYRELQIYVPKDLYRIPSIASCQGIVEIINKTMAASVLES